MIGLFGLLLLDYLKSLNKTFLHLSFYFQNVWLLVVIILKNIFQLSQLKWVTGKKIYFLFNKTFHLPFHKTKRRFRKNTR